MPGLKPDSTASLDLRSRPMVVAIDVDDEVLGIRDLFSLADFRDNIPILRAEGNGVLFTLHNAPAPLVAVLASDLRSERTMRFLKWLGSHGLETPPLLHCQAGDAAGVLRDVVARLTELARAGENRRATTAWEAKRMHAINSHLQHQFQVAEQALHRRGAAQPQLAFVNEPAPGSAQQIVLDETDGAIVQVLPFASSGVSAIGVHFAAAGDNDASRLDACLLSLEDDTVLARWFVPVRLLRAGWNLLGLARSPAGPARTLELHLACNGAEGRLPALSLGTPQPIPTFRTKSALSGEPVMTNSLALQVWRFIPGAMPPHDLAVHQALQPGLLRGGFVDLQLGSAALAQVEHANATDVQFDFPAVISPPGEDIVLCHPPSRGITMGRLPAAAPSAALRISASAFIGHEKSKDIDFGIVVTDSADRASDISHGVSLPDPHEAFSGWCKVSQGEVRRLSAFREPSGSGAQSIFVATRMSQPGDNSHAWARFKDFSLMVQAR